MKACPYRPFPSSPTVSHLAMATLPDVNFEQESTSFDTTTKRRPSVASTLRRTRKISRRIHARGTSLIGSLYAKTSMSECGGIHAYAVLKATGPHRGLFCSVGMYCISLLVLLLQALILSVVISDGTQPTCASAHDCLAGMYCSQKFGSGLCNDCSAVLPSTSLCCPTIAAECIKHYQSNGTSNFSQSDAGRAVASSAPFGTTAASYACPITLRCTSEDTMPSRCDFLVRGRMRVKHMSLIIIFLGCTLLGVPIVKDLDQADAVNALVHYRLDLMHKHGRLVQRIVLSTLAVVVRRLRKYVLPCLVRSATVVLLLTASDGDLSAVDILLNILTISFITELDDMISLFVVHPGMEEEAEEVLIARQASHGAPKVQWLANRCTVLTIICVLSLEVLFMEPLMVDLEPMYDYLSLARFGADYSIIMGLPRQAPLCNYLKQTVTATSIIYLFISSSFELIVSLCRGFVSLRRDKDLATTRRSRKGAIGYDTNGNENAINEGLVDAMGDAVRGSWVCIARSRIGLRLAAVSAKRRGSAGGDGKRTDCAPSGCDGSTSAPLEPTSLSPSSSTHRHAPYLTARDYCCLTACGCFRLLFVSLLDASFTFLVGSLCLLLFADMSTFFERTDLEYVFSYRRVHAVMAIDEHDNSRLFAQYAV